MANRQDRPERTTYAVTAEDYYDRDNGICLACGEIRYGGTEPDARNYPCDACGERRVFGLEEALLMDRITVEGE